MKILSDLNLKRFLGFLLLATFAATSLNLTPQASAAEENFNLKITMDKPTYTTADITNFTLLASNGSNKPLRNVRIILSISNSSSRKTLASYRWSRSFSPGATKIPFTRKISTLRGEGTYPIVAKAEIRGKALARANSTLVVVNPRPGVFLNVVLVLSLGKKVHHNPEGEFVDEEIKSFLSKEPHGKDLFFRHLETLSQHPNIRANLSIAPFLLEELWDMSNGYREKKGKKVNKVKDNSTTSRNAAGVLKGYSHLIRNEQVEILASPYACPDLISLGERDWNKDIEEQISEGKRVYCKILGLPEDKEIAGLCPPGLELDSNSLKTLSKSKITYTVLKEKIFRDLSGGGNRSIFKPYRLQDAEANRVTAFVNCDGASETLAKIKDEEEATQKMLSLLAPAYLASSLEEKTAVIVLDDSDKINSSLFNLLYTKLETVPWLRSVTLETALKMNPPAPEPLLLGESTRRQSYLETTYYEKIKLARRKFYLFAAVSEENGSLEEKMLKNLLLAENRSWLDVRRNPELVNLGLDFIKEVKKQVASEFAKITLARGKTITLTSKKGKIPLAVQNGTNYRMKMQVTLKEKGLSFPKGNTRDVTLNPKENLFSFPVEVQREGTYSVDILFHKDGKVIKRDSLTVKTASLPRETILVAVLVFVLVGLIFFGWHRKKLKTNNQDT